MESLETTSNQGRKPGAVISISTFEAVDTSVEKVPSGPTSSDRASMCATA